MQNNIVSANKSHMCEKTDSTLAMDYGNKIDKTKINIFSRTPCPAGVIKAIKPKKRPSENELMINNTSLKDNE
jgi:hypothetical protein